MSSCARSATRRNDTKATHPSRASILQHAAVKSACKCDECAKGKRSTRDGYRWTEFFAKEGASAGGAMR